MEAMQKIVKFSTQTTGRDRIFRLVQYSSKFSWWLLEQLNKEEDLIERVKKLEYALSTGRKLIRLGKSIDIVQDAMKTIHLPDLVLRLTLTLSKINQALYILLDNVIWAQRTGLVQVDKKKYARISAKFWLTSIILALSRDMYELSSILGNKILTQGSGKFQNSTGRETNGDPAKGHDGESQAGRPPPPTLWLLALALRDNRPLTLDILKNSADLFLPLCILGYFDFNPGTQGLLGIVSSIVGVLTVWNASLKLKP